MSIQPNRRTFSYRDEEALVRYLVTDLERKLSGRHETRILRIIPSDHCHLGVLGPRDPLVVQPEAIEPDGEAAATPGDRRPLGQSMRRIPCQLKSPAKTRRRESCGNRSGTSYRGTAGNNKGLN